MKAVLSKDYKLIANLPFTNKQLHLLLQCIETEGQHRCVIMLHMAVDIEQRKYVVIVSCVQLLSNFRIFSTKPGERKT